VNHRRDQPAGDSAGQPLNRAFERHRVLAMRDGSWLVRCGGVLAEISEPPPLSIRPFENAQIAESGVG
jgi:hypothetical protein